MRSKLTPEDLKSGDRFELLAEVSHLNLREFVVEQITKEKYIIRSYSVYQVIMLIVFGVLLIRSILIMVKGHSEALVSVVLAIIFSFTLLIIIHELLHALAYLLTGARQISFGFIPRKFIFYALADRQVIAYPAFHLVALTPFVIVNMICFVVLLATHNSQLIYFFLTVMCMHSLFCAGDMAMLAFYNLHRGKEIFNFDDRSEGKTYFYTRRSQN
ncbi:MAG: DUF3267 domain-containing protein [Bacteroidota bacterium]|nr:DUF3267 domain-containing protein [Bacteroidota bacterium]